MFGWMIYLETSRDVNARRKRRVLVSLLMLKHAVCSSLYQGFKFVRLLWNSYCQRKEIKARYHQYCWDDGLKRKFKLFMEGTANSFMKVTDEVLEGICSRIVKSIAWSKSKCTAEISLSFTDALFLILPLAGGNLLVLYGDDKGLAKSRNVCFS
ncbi:hypothetical protein Tco_1319262 [Tanacetum coccineum]